MHVYSCWSLDTSTVSPLLKNRGNFLGPVSTSAGDVGAVFLLLVLGVSCAN